MRRGTARAVLLLWSALCAVAVQAEEASDIVLEEIIVTATKRAESLQDVPIAVTAISAETLDRAGIKDLRDLQTVATSFNLNSSQTESQGTTLRIRGVGTTGNNIGLESAVGVFLDGVYQSRPGIALGDLLDVEQIEVLRGPQGTLFGRNTTAGALNIRTAKPNLQETEFFANVTAGNFDQNGLQAGVSGPLIKDKLGYRLSGAIRNQDGFLDSTTGAESRNRDRYLLRGQLQWDISDRADLRIIADYSDADEQCCDAVILAESPVVPSGAFAAAGLPADGGVQASGFGAASALTSNAEQFDNPFEQAGLSAELNVDLSDSITLTYIGAWRDFDAQSVQESDFVGLDVFSLQPSEAQGFESFDEIRTITHELRIAGETERVSWMVGAYYSDEEIQEQQGLGLGTDFEANVNANIFNFVFQDPALAPVFAALGGLPLPATNGLTLGQVLASASPAGAFAGGADFSQAFAQNEFNQDSTSLSFFTHNSIHINENLDIVLGARWTEEDKDGSFEQFAGSNTACLNSAANTAAINAAIAGGPLEGLGGTLALPTAFGCFPFAVPVGPAGSGLPEEFDDKFEDEELIWTAKVVYNLADNITTFASFTHGFKAGGFNLDPTAALGGADPRFDSELIDAFEVGLKAEWFDRRLRTNVSIFSYELEDFQVLEFTGVQFQTFNVPEAVSEGFELEFSGTPVAGLELNLGYTRAVSRYPNDCDQGEAVPDIVLGLCGNNFTNSPENVITLGVNYDGRITDELTWFFNGSTRWEDNRRTSTQPDLLFDVQDSNTRTNLRVGLGQADGRWAVELWGNNITDRRTRNVTFNTPLRIASRGAFLEAPRTWGVTLRTRL